MWNGIELVDSHRQKANQLADSRMVLHLFSRAVLAGFFTALAGTISGLHPPKDTL